MGHISLSLESSFLVQIGSFDFPGFTSLLNSQVFGVGNRPSPKWDLGGVGYVLHWLVDRLRFTSLDTVVGPPVYNSQSNKREGDTLEIQKIDRGGG